MQAVYQYEQGDTLQLVYQGQKFDFRYTGICHAPDYIYSIPPGGAMIPDGEVYDIACIDESRMEKILGKRDSYTELGFLLEPGYTYEDVKSQLKEELEVYGLVSICERGAQISFDMVESEMAGLISVGSALPVIFMAISVFMLYVVLKKMIDRDQRLIGTMKAFGMTDRELMAGYLVDTGKIIGSYRDMMGSMIFMIYMFALMAVAAGGILIYNISMINIRERITEFGTLMIMGMPEAGIRSLLLMEHGVYFAAGILMGIPGSIGIKLLIEKLAVSDSYSLKMHVSPPSYVMAFVICLVITAVACLAEDRFIQSISLTDTLKERE